MVKKRTVQKSRKDFRVPIVVSFLLVIGLTIAVAISTQPQKKTSFASTSGMVYREGKTLMLNGSPYKFVGFNAYGAISNCEPAGSWSREQMDAYFSQLPPASMTRVWAFSRNGTDGMDQLIASAEQHNQKVILTLENDLRDCTSTGAKNNAWYQSGYKGAYLTWVKTVAARYANSPAVGMYEAINEAGQAQGEGKLDGATMKAFYDETTNAIKSVDPNHLVGTGDNAEFNYSGGKTAYQTAISGVIDVASLHDYESDYIGNPPVISSHFSIVKSAADAVNKPIIIGEMNDSANTIGTSARAANVKNSITAYLDNGASGVLVWDRSYDSSYTDSEGYRILNGDPLVGVIQSWVIPGIVVTPQSTGNPTVTSTVATPTESVTSIPTATSIPTPTSVPTIAPASPTPTVAAGVNLLKNPSFESGLSSWTFVSNNSKSNKAAVTSRTKADGRQSAVITIGAASPTIWAIQLEQGNIPLTAGKTYTISFWAKASKTRTIDIVTQQQGGNWTEYHQVTPNLTTAWKKYTYSFNAPATAISSFAFNLAKIKGTVWLDGVSLTSN